MLPTYIRVVSHVPHVTRCGCSQQQGAHCQCGHISMHIDTDYDDLEYLAMPRPCMVLLNHLASAGYLESHQSPAPLPHFYLCLS